MGFLKNKLNNLDQNNINKFVLIIGIVVGLLLMAGGTYAYYQSSAKDTTSVSGTAGCFQIDYEKGNNISMINGDFKLLDENLLINSTTNKIKITNGMGMTYVKAGINKDCNIAGTLTISMDVTALDSEFISGDCAGALKYVIASFNPNSYSNLSVNGLNGLSFDILSKQTITSTGKSDIYSVQLPEVGVNGYLIIFYVDGNLANTRNTEGDEWAADFSATISAKAVQNTN